MTLVMACLWRWYNMQEFSSCTVAIGLFGAVPLA
jgi:hypothetical protein